MRGYYEIGNHEILSNALRQTATGSSKHEFKKPVKDTRGSARLRWKYSSSFAWTDLTDGQGNLVAHSATANHMP